MNLIRSDLDLISVPSKKLFSTGGANEACKSALRASRGMDDYPQGGAGPV